MWYRDEPSRDQKPPPAITTNKMQARTEGNSACPWSVGVMNLTESEADTIIRYARAVQQSRYSESAGRTAAINAAYGGERGVDGSTGAEINLPTDGQRRPITPAVTDEMRAAMYAELTNPPKPYLTGRFEPEESAPSEPVGNRFSGLDIE